MLYYICFIIYALLFIFLWSLFLTSCFEVAIGSKSVEDTDKPQEEGVLRGVVKAHWLNQNLTAGVFAQSYPTRSCEELMQSLEGEWLSGFPWLTR